MMALLRPNPLAQGRGRLVLTPVPIQAAPTAFDDRSGRFESSEAFEPLPSEVYDKRPPRTGCPLLELPCELRFEIYQHLFQPLLIHCAFSLVQLARFVPSIRNLLFRITSLSPPDVDARPLRIPPTETAYDDGTDHPDAPPLVRYVHTLETVPQNSRWRPGFSRSYEVGHDRRLARDRFRGISLACKLLHAETETLKFQRMRWSMCDPVALLLLIELSSPPDELTPLPGERFGTGNLFHMPPSDIFRHIRNISLTCDIGSAHPQPNRANGYRNQGISPATAKLADWTSFWSILSDDTRMRIEGMKVWLTYHSPLTFSHVDTERPTLDNEWIAPMLSLRIQPAFRTIENDRVDCQIKWHLHSPTARNTTPLSRENALERDIEDRWMGKCFEK